MTLPLYAILHGLPWERLSCAHILDWPGAPGPVLCLFATEERARRYAGNRIAEGAWVERLETAADLARFLSTMCERYGTSEYVIGPELAAWHPSQTSP